MNRRLYAYLNINHPLVAWEVAIGRIKSICDNNEEEFGVSLWFYGLLEKLRKNSNDSRVINELKLELLRLNKFDQKVSRLTGVYFFSSKELAETALDRWGLPHQKKYISEVYFSGNSYTEVDSEWITTYLKTKNTDWMKSYWNGDVLGVKPLTEIIASGIGIIQNNDLRLEAYKKIIKKWPTTSILLNACMASFAEYKIERIGLAIPALINTNGTIKASYYIDMNDFNKRQPEVISALERATKKGMSLPYIKPNDPDKIFSVCDWSNLSFEIENKDIIDLIKSIHHY